MPRDLSAGCTGQDVAVLQGRLNYRMPPWSMQLAVDRIFGPKTAAAVREYQKLHNLKPDGIVGPLTRGALNTRLFLMKGKLYREVPAEEIVAVAAAPSSRSLFAQTTAAAVTQTPSVPPPPPPPGTTVFQLQPNITTVLPPWIFPPGKQPGTIWTRSLQLSVVYKSGDGVGHFEVGPFLQISGNSQSAPSDPKVSFTGGYQFVAADLIAPWKLPLLGWKFHPVSLVFQQTLVFNARPGSVVLGLSFGEQAQLDLGSDRFGVVISGAVGPNADLTHSTMTLGAQGMVGGVVQF